MRLLNNYFLSGFLIDLLHLLSSIFLFYFSNPLSTPTVMSYDTTVVGGGTAGCTIAAIVSENPDHRVLLLEAGHEYLPSSQGPDADAVSDARRAPMRGHSIRFDHSTTGISS